MKLVMMVLDDWEGRLDDQCSSNTAYRLNSGRSV